MKRLFKILPVFAIAVVAFFGVKSNVSADQSPVACTNNDFVVNIGKSTSTAYDETSPFGATTITYTVSTGNPNTSGTGCDVSNVNVDLTTPDGVIHNLQSGGSYVIGTAVSNLGLVNYDANSADEVGDSLIASVHATGDLHDTANEDPLDISKQVTVHVINPNTLVSVGSSASQVLAGGTVDLTVTEANNGDVGLTSPSVVVNDGSSDIATLVAAPDSGDTDNDGVLDPGETWQWVVNGVTVNADTTFVVTGHGTDPLNHDITVANGFSTEEDSVDVDVISPTTITTISSSASQVLAGGTVDLTVTEENDGDTDLTNAYVDVDNGVGTLDSSSAGFSGDDGDGVLEPGEVWSWTVTTSAINADTTFTATGHGTDSLGNDVTFPSDQDEQDSVDVDVVNPTTITTITSSATDIATGDTVTLTVTEENDGDTDLTDAHVDVDNGVGTLDSSSPNFSGDDGDGVLEPGETWMWTVAVTVNATTTYMATGFGTDPFGNIVTYPTDPEEQDSVTVNVTELSCTLTQGYWKTHSSYGPAAHPDDTWATVGGPDATFFLSGKTWIEVFNTAPSGNAYYILADQYMAAVLNVNSGASVPAGVQTAINDATTLFNTYTPAQIAAMKGNNSVRQQFITLAGILGDYNEGVTGPGHCSE